MSNEKQRFLKRLFTALLVVMITLSFVNATVWEVDDWKDNKRTLYVYIEGHDKFKEDVKWATDTWNHFNSGRNRWEFKITTNVDNADIKVKMETLSSFANGRTILHPDSGPVTHAEVFIDKGLYGFTLYNTILHELGHCMLLDDTTNEEDIMYYFDSEIVEPSEEDLKEASASDQAIALIFNQDYIVREANSKALFCSLRPGSNINLEDVEDISIACLTGPDLYTHVEGWNANGITVEFYAKSSASYNEVIGVTLKYPGEASTQGYSVQYTGVLTITEKKAPKNSFPHAVAGDNITVSESEPVVFDGSGSYHDDPKVFFTSTWLISGDGDTGCVFNGALGELTLPPGTYTATLIVKDYYARTSEDSITVTVESTGIPEISVNRSSLNFGSYGAENTTGPQTLQINNTGEGTLNWSIGNDASWLTCSPSSGSNEGVVTVSADVSGLAAGTYTGTIAITDPNASNSPQTVTVDLTVMSASQEQPPFGSFETPVHGSTVRGSIAVSGWVLDDVEVENVKIYNGPSYVGDAVFVEGARPDIEQSYPGYPKNYQSGWGYMLLTYFLPNGGNGTYTLFAKATDSAGHQVTLGSKTITVDNANAVKPFGAIDTPTQGGTASGSSFVNWGWVLTPQPNSIPTDGSTINVFVDGGNLGHPKYNLYRADIADLFPNYANSNGAAGYYSLDTTAYENGVHIIHWTAADSGGNSDGIGSRYFTIQNTNPGNSTNNTTHETWNTWGSPKALLEIPVDYLEPVKIIKGHIYNVNSNVEPENIYPDEKGISTIEIKELERLVILFNGNRTDAIEERKGLDKDRLLTQKYFGYHVVGSQLKPLPIGSTLDKEIGIFYWQPGPGFTGEYRLVFVEKRQDGEINRKDIKVTIGPKFKKGRN